MAFLPVDWACIFVRETLIGEYTSRCIQINRTKSVFGFSFSYTRKCDHAGVMIELSLFSYEVYFSQCDTRHWDEDTKAFKVYP